MILQINAPDDLMEELRVYCFNVRKTKREVVIDALKSYFADKKENTNV